MARIPSRCEGKFWWSAYRVDGWLWLLRRRLVGYVDLGFRDSRGLFRRRARSFSCEQVAELPLRFRLGEHDDPSLGLNVEGAEDEDFGLGRPNTQMSMQAETRFVGSQY